MMICSNRITRVFDLKGNETHTAHVSLIMEIVNCFVSPFGTVHKRANENSSS